MAGNYKPSFVQRVRGSTARINPAGPKNLNFKTKINLRRVEVFHLQMLSEINF